MTMSGLYFSFFFKKFIKCLKSSISKELSFDIFFGLKTGTSAPSFLAIIAYFLLSVETITLSIKLHDFANKIE